MPLLNKRADKKEKHLLVSVGHHEVTVALMAVQVRQPVLGEVLWQRTEKISEHELVGEEQRISRYARAVGTTLRTVPREEIRHTKHIAVVLHHPWAGSFRKRIAESYRRPVVFTKQLQNQLHNKARKEFEDLQEAGGSMHAQVMVQLQPLYAELNGYTFKQPLKKRAEEVAITFQYDLVQQAMMDAVTNAIRSEIPHHRIELFAYQSLLETAAEKLLPMHTDDTALFVLVESLRTNVLLRDKRGYIEQRIVQIGFEALLEFIMTRFKKSHKQAEHLLELYLAGQVEHGLTERLDHQLREFIEAWTRQTKHAVSSLLRDIGQPNQVLYTVSDECRRVIQPEHIERAILDATPQALSTTFFDFRDNILLKEGRGIVAKQEAHLYMSSLL